MDSTSNEVVVAHRVRGRTRLRVPAALRSPEAATRLTEMLAALPGIRRVEMDRRTGSVLCIHDVDLAAEALVPAVMELARASDFTGPPPEAPPTLAPSRVAQALAEVFHDLNGGVLRATEGRLDLGTLATITFVGAGALRVAVKRELPAHQWFNLAWWGFRTFMTFEGAAIRASRGPTEPPP